MRTVRCNQIPVIRDGDLDPKQYLKKLGTSELWIYRMIHKISGRDHVSNEEILRRVYKNRQLVLVLQLIRKGNIAGGRSRGRCRMPGLRNLDYWKYRKTIHTSPKQFSMICNTAMFNINFNVSYA